MASGGREHRPEQAALLQAALLQAALLQAALLQAALLQAAGVAACASPPPSVESCRAW